MSLFYLKKDQQNLLF